MNIEVLVRTLMESHPIVATIFTIAGVLWTIATVFATFTRTDLEDSFLSKVGRFFDRIGIQFKQTKEIKELQEKQIKKRLNSKNK